MPRVPCTFALAAVLASAAFGGPAPAADTSAAALPQLRIDDVRRLEGNSGQTTFAFTVTLSPRSTERVQVDYATLNSTATGGGVDFWSVNGTLFIEPGQATGTIPVLVKGDLEDEPDERFSVRLSSPVGAALADFIGEGTIVNDDAPGVHLLEPNGGEVLHTGDPGWIRWRTSGPGDSAMTLSLSLSLDGGGQFDAIATRLPNTGAFLWDPVTFSTGGDDDPVFSAVLKIEAALPSRRTATDVSDAPFAIHDDPARIATLTRLEMEPTQPACLTGVTLRASVSPAAATGVIDFLDGVVVLGSVALDSSGTATLAISPFAARAHEILALYRGDRIHRSSRSSALVNGERTPTQAALDTAASPTCTEVKLVLEVTPTAASGLARFRDGGTWIGDAIVTDGRATLVARGFDVGPHAFTAEYEGNGCFLPSASDTLRARVLSVPSTVAVSSDVNPAQAGERVVFTAAITPAGTGGEVEFLDGGTSLGRAPVVVGVATLNATLGDMGEHLVTAAFAGDACRMAGESPPYVQRVAAEPELSIGNASAPEGSCGSHSLPFAVRLSSASTAVVTVRFTTADGTATAADSDYLPASGQVRFAPGETSKEIFVTILEDLRDEGDEDLRVTLFEPTAATIGDGSADGRIVDDDQPWPEDPPRFIQQWGEPGSGPAQFHGPLRAAVRDDNELWVGDTENGRIQIFSLKGAFKRIWPGNVGPLEGFDFDSVHVFTGAGEAITKWSAGGAPLRVWGGFVHVSDLALDSHGDVFVADGGFVHHFDNDGGFVHKWSAPLPLGIAIGPGDEVLMTSGDGRLHRYTREGFPAAGAPTDACFERPAGAAVDRAGNLYIADTDHHRIQKFRRDGAFLTMWGSEGSMPGQFRRPTDIAIDSSGNAYVVDSDNHRIQKFGPPDHNAPIVFCPPDTTVACGSAGVVVAFSPAGAEDDQDPSPRVECVPISGSFFPAGTTRVVCTATDQTGNASSCHFDVTVRSEPCGDKSLVRIDEVALGCANGDTIQFIELGAVGDGQKFSGGLLLRVHDRADRLVLERANLFPTRTEGEPWPAERRWLIGTESLASAGVDPDLSIPPLLDPLGGRITILVPGSTGYEVVDEVAYGMVGGSEAPLPGHSLQRQADGSMAAKPTPDPTRFDGGSANGLLCPCPMNVISYCEGLLRSTEPSLSGGGTCHFIGGATGSSSGRYDLRSGSLEAFGSGDDCIDHHNGGRATVQVSDVYYVTGVPAGTPLSFHIVFRLQIGSSNCSNYPLGGTGWARGTMAADDSILSAETGNGSSLDTTLRAPMAVPANQPFRVSLECEAAGAVGGSGGATGRLSFSGLPPGARMTSCQGFVGDVAVPVQASIEAIEVQSDFVRLQWYLPAVTSPVGVERAHDEGPWMLVREERPRQDRVEFIDRDIVAGAKYGYRLAWQDGGITGLSPAIWVSIPADQLSLEPPVPNPTSGEMILRFDLRAGLSAAIVLVDVAGRRMFEQDLRGYAAGRHELAVPSSLALAPGLYFVRLSQGDERRTRRVLVAR